MIATNAITSQKSNGEELARVLISCLTLHFQFTLTNLLTVSMRASVNNAAMTILKVVFPLMLGVSLIH